MVGFAKFQECGRGVYYAHRLGQTHSAKSTVSIPLSSSLLIDKDKESPENKSFSCLFFKKASRVMQEQERREVTDYHPNRNINIDSVKGKGTLDCLDNQLDSVLFFLYSPIN